MGYIDRGLVAPVLNDTSAASANVAAIQAALTIGGRVQIIGSGIAYVNAKLVIGSNTTLLMDPNLTIRQVTGGVGKNILVNSAYALNTFASVAITWTAGLTASVALTGHGRSVGDKFWIKGVSGTTDCAYCGVFPVLSVTDANNFVIGLRELPAAAASGATVGCLADRNISIEGGTIDYNFSNTTATGTTLETHAVILAGIGGLRVQNVTATDTSKFCFAYGALSDFVIDGTRTFKTNSDGIKLYGPAFDGQIMNSNLQSGDDGISLHPLESTAFPGYDFTGGGSVCNVKVRNTRVVNASNAGNGIAIYATNFQNLTDVDIDGVTGRAAGQMVIIRNSDSIDTAGRVGSVILKNVSMQDITETLGLLVSGTVVVDNLVIDNIGAPISPPVGFTGAAISIQTATIKKVTIKNARAYFPTATYSFVSLSSSPNVDQLTFQDCYFGSGANLGRILNAPAGGTLNQITFERVEASGILKIIDDANASAHTVLVRDCIITSAQGITLAGAVTPRIVLRDNKFKDQFQGILRHGSSGLAPVEASGNQLLGSAIMFAFVSSGGASLKGWDVSADVTTLTRVDGSFCNNSNAAAGTLGAAGMVMCQGTASSSWHLLADPTKVY